MEQIKHILSQITNQPGKSSSESGKSEPRLPEPCPTCNGAGYVYPLYEDGRVNYHEMRPCKCQEAAVEQQMAETLLRYCQLPPGTEHMTFDTFTPNGKGILELALATAKAIASGEGPVRFLTLAGTVDQGKTHLAIAITREWLSRRKPARFCNVPLLLKELRDGFELEGENSYRLRFDRLCKTPLLVLDDLGAQKPTSWSLEQLQTLIDYRALHGLSLVVTTNRPLASIAGDSDKPDGELRLANARIASRLQRESYCRVVVLDGRESRTWRLGR